MRCWGTPTVSRQDALSSMSVASLIFETPRGHIVREVRDKLPVFLRYLRVLKPRVGQLKRRITFACQADSE